VRCSLAAYFGGAHLKVARFTEAQIQKAYFGGDLGVPGDTMLMVGLRSIMP